MLNILTQQKKNDTFVNYTTLKFNINSDIWWDNITIRITVLTLIEKQEFKIICIL